VAKKKTPDNLSVDELRWMLVEKRRAARQERLERFRRTGRAVVIAPDVNEPSFDDLHTGSLSDHDEALSADESSVRSRPRRILDGFLLVIEISAVLGFIFVLFNGLSLIRELNQEVATALEQPTLTPTPLIVAVVLPSLVQSLANVPLPTPGPEQAVRIQVPSINVDAPVVQGDGWEQLKKGVGQHVGSADPGKDGNVVLSAHNDIFGEIFRDLDRLETGDQVILYTNQRSYTYVIVDSKIVEPTDVSVMDDSAQPTVTLISCYPYLVDKNRIVITARLQNGG
jgi:sortase A